MKNTNHSFGSNDNSENFYRHKPSLILYTDGIKELAEKCGAYWLIDLIISQASLIHSPILFHSLMVRNLFLLLKYNYEKRRRIAKPLAASTRRFSV